MNTTGATLAIFDLDGVLTRADTMATLVGGRLKARPHRLVAALPLVLAAVSAPPDSALKPAVNRRLVALALRGMSRSEYEELAGRVGRTLAERTTVVRQAVAVCAAAVRRGPTVVATASEETLARAFLDGVGLGGIPLIASRLEYTARGPRLAAHNVGEAKLHAVRRAGFAPEDAIFYTDSASDTPLARAARKTVAVNADRRSIRKFAADGTHVDHEHWR
ncbi:haloacid dehalogenase-like hydrolase [Yinghuangia sp. ASG 101]|uniref:haloacid dehalogenase-like hydrolase n=1 Tax=Yinghuangia sp. ASG 101 TaxID=2896848 RepID=UPI001E4E7A6E|nr:haloacid dehalogenase-like hydrolase [Yinghuangia sp. ASG 101]UGQ11356.1 haloacid dehalogenase-like hydrolase [Yinghuangia sp. ASG 101]